MSVVIFLGNEDTKDLFFSPQIIVA